MSAWSRLHSNHFHKDWIEDVSRSAVLLDLEMQAYCESQENDGIFRLSAVKRESTTETPEADIAELVRVGRWEMLPESDKVRLVRLPYWDLDSGDGGQRTSTQTRATRNADRIRAACSRGNHSECPANKWCQQDKASRRDSRHDSRKESGSREEKGSKYNPSQAKNLKDAAGASLSEPFAKSEYTKEGRSIQFKLEADSSDECTGICLYFDYPEEYDDVDGYHDLCTSALEKMTHRTESLCRIEFGAHTQAESESLGDDGSTRFVNVESEYMARALELATQARKDVLSELDWSEVAV